MDAVASISEILFWVGLITAILFGSFAGILRLARGPWESAPAAISDDTLRWMTEAGDFHTCPAWSKHPAPDDLVIHYRTRRPDVAHPEPVAHDERAFGLIAAIVGAVAVIALVVGSVAQLM